MTDTIKRARELLAGNGDDRICIDAFAIRIAGPLLDVLEAAEAWTGTTSGKDMDEQARLIFKTNTALAAIDKLMKGGQ